MTNRIITGHHDLFGTDYSMDDPFDLTDCPVNADDFDMDALNDDYYKACYGVIESFRPGWELLRNGDIIAPIDSPDLSEDEKKALYDLISDIDMLPIFEAHEITD